MVVRLYVRMEEIYIVPSLLIDGDPFLPRFISIEELWRVEITGNGIIIITILPVRKAMYELKRCRATVNQCSVS